MESKEALEHFIMYLQTINRHLRSQMFDQQAASLTRVQWLLMRNLYRNGASTIGQLAEHLDVRSSTMSQMVDRLEKAGFAYRESSDPDARVRWVKLTEQGERVIRQTEALWAETLSEPFKQFSDAERQQLLEYMHRLSDALPSKRT
ncbi:MULTISPECIES: MarR family transcriptional regulator [unclassified Paenibacillus]|uniref:MarR family winged helix-turn-helix transcriptional regulator n=1 Tax=unclassified Paenibacillus TaxID=185978 RepID=UPI001AE61757|nr:MULTISPECIES: MarR family transcriptional regulator [unclassified Paenibacillus]MBP1155520.1 DNA-binding MarR family transcriptional regulator [Paenibacillus sp. PvP091]MBP1169094.1 DNA-binding MarR family transcriptional regulator [Paenibacillus sp. PvR098]MBP2440122.1 DNA-binding MarR family transcriptional regulator [Paenibacillus sp. PvP052]